MTIQELFVSKCLFQYWSNNKEVHIYALGIKKQFYKQIKNKLIMFTIMLSVIFYKFYLGTYVNYKI